MIRKYENEKILGVKICTRAKWSGMWCEATMDQLSFVVLYVYIAAVWWTLVGKELIGISRAGCNVLLSYLLNHKATNYQVKPWRATNAFFLSLSRSWERYTSQSRSQILSNHQQCGRCFLPTWTADHCLLSRLSDKTFYSKNMAPTAWPEIKSQRLKH